MSNRVLGTMTYLAGSISVFSVLCICSLSLFPNTVQAQEEADGGKCAQSDKCKTGTCKKTCGTFTSNCPCN